MKIKILNIFLNNQNTICFSMRTLYKISEDKISLLKCFKSRVTSNIDKSYDYPISSKLAFKKLSYFDVFNINYYKFYLLIDSLFYNYSIIFKLYLFNYKEFIYFFSVE